MNELTPFRTLGEHLKYVRETSRQTLAEVSGAVEIDEQELARIEAGQERPPEDILLLLISHFDVHDQEAVQLWELADYGGDVPEQLRPEIDIATNGKVVMLLAMDVRTMYSDGLDISMTPAGISLNFTQAGNKHVTPVARIGMSYQQAEQVLQQLSQAVLSAKQGPKRLSPGNDSSAADTRQND